MPPPRYKKLARFGLALIIGFSMLLVSCIEEPESPQIDLVETSEIAQVKVWFEENKTKLRLPERGSNFRTESQELILPFFEKEPDWDQFHHYYFPDGREVFEISLENATKYFPSSMLDSFPDRNPAELIIQNIMFVKHPTELRFDPVIARYYPDDVASIKEFKDISYDGIPFDWSGIVDIWTYDERHFIGFNFKGGEIINSFKYQTGELIDNERIAGDCTMITREVSNNYTDENGTVVVVPSTTITETFCTGSGGYTPRGGEGTGENGEYYDYERPTCCDDPVTAPPRDEPAYDPPSIPSPSSIINQLTNPCAADIFKELSKGSAYLTDMNGLGSLDIFPGMLDLFEQSGQFDYRIRNGILSGQNAVTNRVQGVNIITLDNDYLKNATSLSIARTIIHETVHAYLLEHTYDMHLRTTYNTFELMVRFLEKYDEDWNGTHHAAMADFILGMAVSLYNWDKKYGQTAGSLPFDYYYKMAFGGLVNPSDNTQLIDEAKPFIPSGSTWAEIDQILKNEASGSNQANGTKCN